MTAWFYYDLNMINRMVKINYRFYKCSFEISGNLKMHTYLEYLLSDLYGSL